MAKRRIKKPVRKNKSDYPGEMSFRKALGMNPTYYQDGGKLYYQEDISKIPVKYVENRDDPAYIAYKDSFDLAKLTDIQREREGATRFIPFSSIPQSQKDYRNAEKNNLGINPNIPKTFYNDKDADYVTYNTARQSLNNPRIFISPRGSADIFHPSIDPTSVYISSRGVVNAYYPYPKQQVAIKPSAGTEGYTHQYTHTNPFTGQKEQRVVVKEKLGDKVISKYLSWDQYQKQKEDREYSNFLYKDENPAIVPKQNGGKLYYQEDEGDLPIVNYGSPEYEEAYRTGNLLVNGVRPLPEFKVTPEYKSLSDELRRAAIIGTKDAAELTGVPGAVRFVKNPVQSLKGAGNTIVDLGMTLGPIATMNPATGYEYATQGINPLTGEGSFRSEDVEGAFNTLDAAGIATIAGAALKAPVQQGLKQTGKYLTQGPLRNAYKLRSSVLKENPEMFLYRAEPTNFDTRNTVKILQEKLANNEGTALQQARWKNYINEYNQGHPRLVAQNDFHGQWLEKDPARLDWYLHSGDKVDIGTPMSIFRTKIPTSQAAQYNVGNIKKANVVSASPETEFVMPRNIIEQGEKFPESSWQQLIQEDKAFNTPHWWRGYGSNTPKQLPGFGNKFKSEIDWGKWNEEILNNKSLLKEYHEIEKTSKANGTWMKNEDLFKNEIANAQKEYNDLAKRHKELYDGSQLSESYEQRLKNYEELKKLDPIIGEVHDRLSFYKGVKFTPEQFIQLQSSNFKKAFPEGFDRLYRGVQKFNADDMASGSYRNVEEGNILFGTDKLSHAQAYAKNGASGRNLDHFFNAIEQPEFLSPTSKISEKAIQIPDDELLNPGVLDLAYDKRIGKTVFDAKGARWNELGKHGTTDNIASRMRSGEIETPVVQIQNIHDGGNYFGQFNESMNTMIDPAKVRLKSLRYNNGMFDMTNPNIYKSLAPFIGTGLGTYGVNQMQDAQPTMQRFGGNLNFQGGGNYNMQRALELGYTPDEAGHYPSVDSETGMWLKSKQHPTAWMESMYGYQLNPEVYNNYNITYNPEGYSCFGENQLQYVPKKFGGKLRYARGGSLTSAQDTAQAVDLNKDVMRKDIKKASAGEDFLAGLYGVGAGVLQTIDPLGITKGITDAGFKALQASAGHDINSDEAKRQAGIAGWGKLGGAVTGAIINPGAIGSAVKEGLEGVGSGIEGIDPSSDIATGIGTSLKGVAGSKVLGGLNDKDKIPKGMQGFSKIFMARNGGRFRYGYQGGGHMVNQNMGLTEIDGPSHEEGGVTLPNSGGRPDVEVEGPETIYTPENYVMSEKMKASKEALEYAGITGKAARRLAGKSYADLSKAIKSKAGDKLRPADPLSKKMLDKEMKRLMKAHEYDREAKRMKDEAMRSQMMGGSNIIAETPEERAGGYNMYPNAESIAFPGSGPTSVVPTYNNDPIMVTGADGSQQMLTDEPIETEAPFIEQKMAQGGKMIKRADGSYSRRGLWDNIRANRGSGKKPTKQMLEQEAKIKAKMQVGGRLDPLALTKTIFNPNDESTVENVMEVFDPSGISSWDDVYKSYQESGMSPATQLEIFGALPLLGKAGKLGKSIQRTVDLSKLGKSGSRFGKMDRNEQVLKSVLGTGLFVSPYVGRLTDAAQAVQQYPKAPLLPSYKAEGGSFDNPGFRALPDYVQAKIKSSMQLGGDMAGLDLGMEDSGMNMKGAGLMQGLSSFIQPITQTLNNIAETKSEENEYQMQLGGFMGDYIDEDDTMEYGSGGYTVRRSNDRKGKTHVVTGPDGTKKYFGDPKLGERGKSKYGKDAFYARHKKNLAKNPYFRAYARATWEDGGYMNMLDSNVDMVDMETPMYEYGGSMMYGQGGGIHIDPSKRGTFKAQASRMGMGVQQAARTILNAPEGKYSPAMRKKANFARNFAKADGGYMYQMGGEMAPQQAPQQGGQEQIIQAIVEMLQQGLQPEQIVGQLVKMGVPQESAIQAVQMVMQQVQQSQGMQQQQAAPPVEQSMMSQQGAPTTMRGGGRMYQMGGSLADNYLAQVNQYPVLKRGGGKIYYQQDNNMIPNTTSTLENILNDDTIESGVYQGADAVAIGNQANANTNTNANTGIKPILLPRPSLREREIFLGDVNAAGSMPSLNNRFNPNLTMTPQEKTNWLNKTREYSGLLPDEGYAAINKFENTMGTYDAQGKPIGMGRGDQYAQTEDKDKIESFIDSSIGRDTWNRLPDDVKTQMYSFMFNTGKYDLALSGLAQAINNSTGGGDLGDERRAYTKDFSVNAIKGADFNNPNLYSNYVNVLGDQYASIADNTQKYKTGIGANYAPTLRNRPISIHNILYPSGYSFPSSTSQPVTTVSQPTVSKAGLKPIPITSSQPILPILPSLMNNEVELTGLKEPQISPELVYKTFPVGKPKSKSAPPLDPYESPMGNYIAGGVGSMLGPLANAAAAAFAPDPTYTAAPKLGRYDYTPVALQRAAANQALANTREAIRMGAPTQGSYLANVGVALPSAGANYGSKIAETSYGIGAQNIALANQEAMLKERKASENALMKDQSISNRWKLGMEAAAGTGRNIQGLSKDLAAKRMQDMLVNQLRTGDFSVIGYDLVNGNLVPKLAPAGLATYNDGTVTAPDGRRYKYNPDTKNYELIS